LKFYDTNALLSTDIKDLDDHFITSSIVIQELENIKTSRNKTEDTRYMARKVAHVLDGDRCDIILYTSDHEALLKDKGLPVTNDNLIVAAAYEASKKEDIEFCSGDIVLRLTAKNIFGLKISQSIKERELYLGYRDVVLDPKELENFYASPLKNSLGINVNEYAFIKNETGDVVDYFKWTPSGYINVAPKAFKSKLIGSIKPLDDIQRCAFDSIVYNDITLLYGRAGSGKTTIPLAYIAQNLENEKIRKCYMIYHYETLRNAKTLGYEKGSHYDKLINTASIGGILETKFGSITPVENMINSGKLEIVPTANIRGMEFGEEDMVFCTESQSLDVYTLKTIVQRGKKGCKFVIEGDMLEQRDTDRECGMARMIEIFKGNKNFGCIKLKNNYRNELSELADSM